MKLDAMCRSPLLGAALLPLLLGSCMAPRSYLLESALIERFEGTPHKIFVIAYEGAGVPRPFQDGYVAAVESELAKLGAEVGVAKVTGLELDRNAHIKAMEAFQADVSLIVHFDLIRTRNGVQSGQIRLNLVRALNERALWVGAQTFQLSHEPLMKSVTFEGGRDIGTQAIQRLLSDGVLWMKPDYSPPWRMSI